MGLSSDPIDFDNVYEYLPFVEDSALFFRVDCFEPKCWVLSNAQYTSN